MTTHYKQTIHFAICVFDGGRVVFRDSLIYMRALNGWTGVNVGGVAVASAARNASPLPSPERAHVSLSIFTSGHLRCTLVNFRAKPLYLSRRVGGAGGVADGVADGGAGGGAGGCADMRALRFQRAALGFKNAACVDLFADPAASAWRVTSLVRVNDSFLREMMNF
jgi:hypothetical protein